MLVIIEATTVEPRNFLSVNKAVSRCVRRGPRCELSKVSCGQSATTAMTWKKRRRSFNALSLSGTESKPSCWIQARTRTSSRVRCSWTLLWKNAGFTSGLPLLDVFRYLCMTHAFACLGATMLKLLYLSSFNMVAPRQVET